MAVSVLPVGFVEQADESAAMKIKSNATPYFLFRLPPVLIDVASFVLTVQRIAKVQE